MPDLISQVTGYLISDGYNVQQRAREVIGERPGQAGTRERIYIWVPEITGRQPFTTQERPYLERFARANQQHPSATKLMVAPTLEGISTSFRYEANRVHGVRLRVPIQFFDTEYKWENSDSLATTALELKNKGKANQQQTIAQPFAATGKFPGEGVDLVQELFSRFHGVNRRTGIHIVQGPAGIGKSRMFSSLYARLHDAFLEDKRAQRRIWARPLPLLPEYDTGQQRLDGLLNTFTQTELERLIPPTLYQLRVRSPYSR